MSDLQHAAIINMQSNYKARDIVTSDAYNNHINTLVTGHNNNAGCINKLNAAVDELVAGTVPADSIGSVQIQAQAINAFHLNQDSVCEILPPYQNTLSAQYNILLMEYLKQKQKGTLADMDPLFLNASGSTKPSINRELALVSMAESSDKIDTISFDTFYEQQMFQVSAIYNAGQPPTPEQLDFAAPITFVWKPQGPTQIFQKAHFNWFINDAQSAIKTINGKFTIKYQDGDSVVLPNWYSIRRYATSITLDLNANKPIAQIEFNTDPIQFNFSVLRRFDGKVEWGESCYGNFDCVLEKDGTSAQLTIPTNNFKFKAQQYILFIDWQNSAPSGATLNINAEGATITDLFEVPPTTEQKYKIVLLKYPKAILSPVITVTVESTQTINGYFIVG